MVLQSAVQFPSCRFVGGSRRRQICRAKRTCAHAERKDQSNHGNASQAANTLQSDRRRTLTALFGTLALAGTARAEERLQLVDPQPVAAALPVEQPPAIQISLPQDPEELKELSNQLKSVKGLLQQLEESEQLQYASELLQQLKKSDRTNYAQILIDKVRSGELQSEVQTLVQQVESSDQVKVAQTLIQQFGSADGRQLYAQSLREQLENVEQLKKAQTLLQQVETSEEFQSIQGMLQQLASSEQLQYAKDALKQLQDDPEQLKGIQALFPQFAGVEQLQNLTGLLKQLESVSEFPASKAFVDHFDPAQQQKYTGAVLLNTHPQALLSLATLGVLGGVFAVHRKAYGDAPNPQNAPAAPPAAVTPSVVSAEQAAAVLKLDTVAVAAGVASEVVKQKAAAEPVPVNVASTASQQKMAVAVNAAAMEVDAPVLEVNGSAVEVNGTSPVHGTAVEVNRTGPVNGTAAGVVAGDVEAIVQSRLKEYRQKWLQEKEHLAHNLLREAEQQLQLKMAVVRTKMAKQQAEIEAKYKAKLADQAQIVAEGFQEAQQIIGDMQQELEAVSRAKSAIAVEKDAIAAEKEEAVAKLAAIASKADTVEAEKEAIAKEKEAAVAEKEALVAKLEALAAQVDVVAEEKEAILQEKASLFSDRESLRANRDAILADRDALKAMHGVWTEAKEKNTAAMQQLQRDVESAMKDRESLAQQLTQTQQVLEQEREAAQAIAQDAEAAKKELQSVLGGSEGVVEHLAASQAREEQLMGSLAEAEARLEEANEQVAKQKEINRAVAEKFDADYSAMKAAITRMQTETEGIVMMQAEEIERLKADQAAMAAEAEQVVTLQAQHIKKLEAERDEAKEKLEVLATALEKEREAVKTLQAEVRAVKQSLSSSFVHINGLQGELTEVQRQAQGINNNVDALTQKIIATEDAISAEVAQNSRAAAQVVVLTRQTDALRTELEETVRKLKDTDTINLDLQERICTLRDTYTAAVEQLQAEQEAANKTQKEIAVLKKQLDGYESQVTQLRREMSIKEKVLSQIMLEAGLQLVATDQKLQEAEDRLVSSNKKLMVAQGQLSSAREQASCANGTANGTQVMNGGPAVRGAASAAVEKLQHIINEVRKEMGVLQQQVSQAQGELAEERQKRSIGVCSTANFLSVRFAKQLEEELEARRLAEYKFRHMNAAEKQQRALSEAGASAGSKDVDAMAVTGVISHATPSPFAKSLAPSTSTNGTPHDSSQSVAAH